MIVQRSSPYVEQPSPMLQPGNVLVAPHNMAGLREAIAAVGAPGERGVRPAFSICPTAPTQPDRTVLRQLNPHSPDSDFERPISHSDIRFKMLS